MVGTHVNAYPILLLLNYWEIRPSLMGSKLDELMRKGVTQIATFVPWQAVESDIAHTLIRFLQAAAERHIRVWLILSPEVGVHYPNSGLPKDLIKQNQNMAQSCYNEKIGVNLPPNSFILPSLFSLDFNKRYYSFLGRMDSIFSDFARNQPNLLNNFTVVLSGSFWKYYRSPRLSSSRLFGGTAGDYSTHAALAYRQRVDHFFSQREFTDPSPSAANRWKARSLEEVNRKWFYQQSEDVFKARSQQMIRKKVTNLKLTEFEIYTPEADPGMAYSNFVQMLSNGHANFASLSKSIDESSTRLTSNGATRSAPFIHWTSMGGFRALSDAEKQFLILKSLLLMGGKGGGVLVDEAEWTSFSQNFRSRADSIARSLSEGEFQIKSQVLYLAPHLWSNSGPLWDELSKRMGPNAKVISSADLIQKENSSRLLVIDPHYILMKEGTQNILSWAKAGRVVAIPRSQFYSEAARAELNQVLLRTKKIEVDLGLSYSLHSLGDGKLILYDVPSDSMSKSDLASRKALINSYENFLGSVLAVAEVETYCQSTDYRLSIIPFERKSRGVAIFLLNSSRKTVNADLVFSSPVKIADLGIELTTDSLGTHQSSSPAKVNSEMSELANHFHFQVPPFAILPLNVEGINLEEKREQQLAASVSKETMESPFSSALSELPGFNMDEGIGDAWT